MGYRVIVPDMPGHGRTEPHPDGAVTNLSTYAEWLLDVVRVLELDRPLVVGCSIGGKITLDIASRAGKGIRGALAMAASAHPGVLSVRGLTRELEDLAAPSRTDRTYYGTRAVVGTAVAEDRRELIARMHCREDPEISTSDPIGWGTHDIRTKLGQVEVPTHVVVGEDDRWISSDLARATADAIPGSDFSLLPGIGHYPMEEMDDFPGFVAGWFSARGLDR
jgi:pimeloyl-ACP methyl ester carboxylesterase